MYSRVKWEVIRKLDKLRQDVFSKSNNRARKRQNLLDFQNTGAGDAVPWLNIEIPC